MTCGGNNFNNFPKINYFMDDVPC